MEIYSFTQFTSLNNNESKKNELRSFGPGHSFFVIYNNTSSDIAVGYYTLPAGESVSVGLWAGQSESQSAEYEARSSIGSCEYNGVYYNREAYQYNYRENMLNAVNYESEITSSELESINSLIVTMNDSYNIISYNCATFATAIWNLATGTTWTELIISPNDVMDFIENEYDEDATYHNYIESSSSFCHLDTMDCRMVTYYYGEE